MKIEKIIVNGQSARNMGEATESDAAGYRAWLEKQLQAEFPGVEIVVREDESTKSVIVRFEGDGDEFSYHDELKLHDQVHDFVHNAWDRCPWSWVWDSYPYSLIE